MYQVAFHAQVTMQQEYLLLDKAQQREMVRWLETNPEAGKPLRGLLQGCRRYRLSDIRVVYKVMQEANVVLILAIGRRRDEEVYGVADKRV